MTILVSDAHLHVGLRERALAADAPDRRLRCRPQGTVTGWRWAYRIQSIFDCQNRCPRLFCAPELMQEFADFTRFAGSELGLSHQGPHASRLHHRCKSLYFH